MEDEKEQPADPVKTAETGCSDKVQTSADESCKSEGCKEGLAATAEDQADEAEAAAKADDSQEAAS